MKKIVKILLKGVSRLFKWVRDLFSLINTLLIFARGGFFRTKIEYHKRPYINLIVNGPSLARVKNRFETDFHFTNRPSMVVNFFANTSDYEILKPKFYTLADPMFFMDFPGKSVEKVKSFYRSLNDKTTWPLIVFIPHSFGRKKFYEYSGLDNPNIKVIEINGEGYNGFESLRNYAYAKGFCAPRAYTVAILGLYACVQMGFQQIDIYGLDNNYYASLSLNEKGEVCDVFQHNGEPDEYRKILDGNGELVTLHDYLLGLTYHLKNHEYMEWFAEYKHVKIFNHSPITMVDAYPRKLN